jgi:hypothetical protein
MVGGVGVFGKEKEISKGGWKMYRNEDKRLMVGRRFGNGEMSRSDDDVITVVGKIGGGVKIGKEKMFRDGERGLEGLWVGIGDGFSKEKILRNGEKGVERLGKECCG